MKFFFLAVGRLPLGFLRLTGAALGQLIWWFQGSPARVMQTNIRLCCPELPDRKAKALARGCCRHLMALLLENFWLWAHTAEQVAACTRVVSGADLLDEAKMSAVGGKGTVLFSMHGCNPDFFARWLPSQWDLSFITYNPPRRRGFDEQMLCELRAGKTNLQLSSVAGGISSLRPLYRKLRQGGVGVVWTDMEPSYGSGELAPFFGWPVQTPVFPNRLASLRDVQSLWCWAKRVRGGFEVHLQPVTVPPNASLQEQVAASNADLEQIVRQLGEQYIFMGYKRFRHLPALEEDLKPTYSMTAEEVRALADRKDSFPRQVVGADKKAKAGKSPAGKSSAGKSTAARKRGSKARAK